MPLPESALKVLDLAAESFEEPEKKDVEPEVRAADLPRPMSAAFIHGPFSPLSVRKAFALARRGRNIPPRSRWPSTNPNTVMLWWSCVPQSSQR